jgi:hypothetical protein
VRGRWAGRIRQRGLGRWAEAAVEGAVQVGGGDGGVQREGGDLGEGVDTGVGAAGALREDALAGGAVDGVGEQALDGGEVGLDLPSAVRGAVVGESELPVRHGDELHGITAGEECGAGRGLGRQSHSSR